MDQDVSIRTAGHSDLPSIMELCRSIGRLVSRDEVSTWMESDPGCFSVAELTTNHKVIASCCGIRHGIELGFMGIYIVHEKYRRLGIGKRIWNHAMERLEGRNIGVRALEGVFLYYKECFRHVADYEIAVYECFDSFKLKGEIPSIHELSIATLFEGHLTNVQSSNIPKERNRISDGNLTTMISSKLAAKKGHMSVNSSSFVTSEDRVIKTSGITDIAFGNVSTESIVFKNNKSVFTPSADPDCLNAFSKVAPRNALLFEFESTSLFHASTSDVSHCYKEFLETSCISEAEKKIMEISSNDLPPQSETNCNAHSNFEVSDVGEINIKPHKRLPAISQSGVSYTNPNKTSVEAITIKKTKLIRFSFNDLLNSIVEYDRHLHNRDRSFVVRQTFFWKSCKTKIAIANDNTVVGYGCLHPCSSDGHWILSPMYADSQEIADILMWELLRDFDFSGAHKGILVRFPDKNTRCTDLLKRFGFRDTGKRIVTSFTKEYNRPDTDRIYAFHTIAFCVE